MGTHNPVPTGTGRTGWRKWLRDPAVLTLIAVVFLVSAAGQAVAQAYLDDDSVMMVAVFSVVGSLFLTAAIIVAALRHERSTRTPRPPGRTGHRT